MSSASIERERAASSARAAPTPLSPTWPRCSSRYDHFAGRRSMNRNANVKAKGATEAVTQDELRKMHQYWRACNYLAVGMIYLRANPLLREPLKPEHVKRRLLGHWGSDPGLSLTYIHLNRMIKKYDLNVIFLAGPGHGAPGVISNVYLE